MNPNLLPCSIVCGLKLEYVSPSVVRVKPGFAYDDAGARIPIQLTEDLLVDITQDLDTGTEQASEFYHVWLAKNLSYSEAIAKFSLSSTDPVLPPDYVAKRRIAVVRNWSNSDFLRFRQFGANQDREYHWLEDRATVLKVLDNGQATSWQDIDFSPLVPETAGLIKYSGHETGNNVAEIRPKGEVMSSYAMLSYDPDTDSNYIAPGTDRKLQYKHSQTGGHLYMFCMGFKEEI